MAHAQLLRLPHRKRPRRKRKLPGDPKYYSRIGRNGHWQPGKALREIGYQNVCCGPDGPEAVAIAENMNRQAFVKRAIMDAVRAVRDAERYGRLQTAEFESQTQMSESQTEEFEIQTVSKDESSSWLRRFAESDIGIGIMAFLVVIALLVGVTTVVLLTK